MANPKWMSAPPVAAEASRPAWMQAPPVETASSTVPKVTVPHPEYEPPQLGSAVGVPGLEHAALPEPVREPVEEDRTRNLRLGTQTGGAGIARLIGAPVDIASASLNLWPYMAEGVVNTFRGDDEEKLALPRIEKPIGGSDWIREQSEQAADAVGFDTIDRKDMDSGERMFHDAGSLAVESLAGGGALSKIAQATRRATPVVGPLTQPYREAAERAATMPTRTGRAIETAKPHIADAAAGAGAGAAGNVAEEQFPDSPTAKAVAMLLGGGLGAAAANVVRAPTSTARGIYDRWFPAPDVGPDPATGLPVRRSTANEAARYMQETASDPKQAAANIGRYADEAKAHGETTPTSALISDDIGLIADERGRRIRAPKEFQERDQFVAQQAEQNVTKLRDPDADPRAPIRYVDEDAAAQRQAAEEPVRQARVDLEQKRSENTKSLSDAETRRAEELTARETEIGQRREAVQTAEDAERELGGTIGARRADETSASERIAGAVDAAKRADESRKSGLYREAETLGRGTRIDPTALADDARAIRAEISPLAGQDQSLNNVLRDLDRLAPAPTKDVPTPEIADLSATDLIAMRPRLSQARDAASRLKRGDVVERLDRINASIKAHLDDLAEQGDAAATKWREAEENFRTDFAPKYREGVGAQLDKAERARTPVRPTEVGGKFLRPNAGGKEAAEDLNRILRGATSEKEGQAAARDFVLADLARVVGTDGKIVPSRLRTWIDNRQGMFEAMPNLREEATAMLRDAVNKRAATTGLQRDLEKAVSARRDSDVRMRKEINTIKADNRLTEAEQAARIAELERKAADVDRSIRQSATGLLADADPVQAVASVFSRGRYKGEDTMREIVTKLKRDPDALKGWKEAVSEYMVARVTNANTAMSKGPDGPLSAAKLKKFFDENSRALAEVYSPDEMLSLRRAHKMIEAFGNLSRQAVSGSATAENVQLSAATIRGLEAGLFATGHGAVAIGMIMRRLKSAVSFLPNPDAAVQHLVTRAAFDPELAQLLLTRNVKEIGSPGWNARLTQILALQEGARESLEPDEEN